MAFDVIAKLLRGGEYQQQWQNGVLLWIGIFAEIQLWALSQKNISRKLITN
jgi:hypothetical protein